MYLLNLDESLAELNHQLPLQARQKSLSDELICLHQFILKSLVIHGLIPSVTELVSLADQA